MWPLDCVSLALLAALPTLTTASTAQPTSQPAAAEASAPSPLVRAAQAEAGGWELAIRPYLWAAGIDGTVTLGGQASQDFDRSFDDIVGDLDFAMMLGFEARPPSGDVGIVVDAVYIDLEGTNDVQATGGTLDWEVEQLLVEIDLAWRVAPSFDLLAGARYVEFETGFTATQSGASASGNDDWVDPIVGARGAARLGERWKLAGRGDVGGFGVGSELSWQLAGYVLFGISTKVDIGLGYRHLDIELDEGDLDFELGFSGPVLGLEIRF